MRSNPHDPTRTTPTLMAPTLTLALTLALTSALTLALNPNRTPTPTPTFRPSPNLNPDQARLDPRFAAADASGGSGALALAPTLGAAPSDFFQEEDR